MIGQSARIQTAVARYIVENGYGIETDIIPSENTVGKYWDLWRGLKAGTIHVLMGNLAAKSSARMGQSYSVGSSVLPLGEKHGRRMAKADLLFRPTL